MTPELVQAIGYYIVAPICGAVALCCFLWAVYQLDKVTDKEQTK